MRAAINLEAVFALLVMLGAMVRVGIGPPSEADSRRSWLLLLVIPAVLLWTLSIPLVSDDFVHIGYALHFTSDKIAGLFTIPAGDHFFRPLGYRLLRDGCALGRTQSRAVAPGDAAASFRQLRPRLPGRPAGGTGSGYRAAAASVLFGVHGSRPEAVTWIACRFDLIATFFVLLTLWLFSASTRRPLLYAAALATAFLALISKEAAYVLPILLLLMGDRPNWRGATPFAALTGAVFAYRWHLLSGIGGYQTAANTPAILNFSVLRTVNALFLRLWAAYSSSLLIGPSRRGGGYGLHSRWEWRVMRPSASTADATGVLSRSCSLHLLRRSRYSNFC